jgi:oligoribonuclease (3'-5' exoribonuclease)
MSAPLAFCDVETTGLDPDQHEIWEVALILRDSEGIEVERTWQLPVDLGKADPMALKIGRFHERYKPPSATYDVPWKHHYPDDYLRDFAHEFANLTVGAHLVGAVISFDEERLRRLLRRWGTCPMWHYHLVDVENLASGFIRGRDGGRARAGSLDAEERVAVAALPWDSEALSRGIGVDPEDFDRHTALGDARWARAIYDRVMGVAA